MIFVGDDSAENHHDVHVMDEAGLRLSSRRLPRRGGAARRSVGLHSPWRMTTPLPSISRILIKMADAFFSYACWALAELVRPDSAIRP